MLRPFSTKGPNGKFFAALNEVIREVNSQRALSSPDMLTSRTTNGVIRKPKPQISPAESIAGLYWPEDTAKNFDPDYLYKANHLAFVQLASATPTNAAQNGENSATAGLWFCTQDLPSVPSAGATNTTPLWPPTGFTQVTADIDDEAIYWWPISLRRVLQVCVEISPNSGLFQNKTIILDCGVAF